MAIKNKDGTTYQLRGPNPLMKDQADWDKTSIKLINLTGKSEIVKDDHNPIEEANSNIVNIRDELKLTGTKVVRASDFIKEINQAQEMMPQFEEPESIPEPVVVPETVVIPDPTPEPTKEVQINLDERLARIIKERGVEFYCAPAVDMKKVKDSLYGSSYETIIYGKQFIFDAIVLAESDLQIQFWSVNLIPINSVILKRDPEGGERWWRVSKNQPKTGGYISLGDISNSNPDFS